MNISFIKRLSLLIRANVPLLDSLHILREQSRSKSEAKVLDKIMYQVSNGESLSGSLAKFHKIFGDFAINIIKVGEWSGTLSENLNYLADELKKKQELRKKIFGALVYPLFITLATLGVTTLLIIYIFPKIMPIFKTLNVELPLSTRILLKFSGILSNDWAYILFGIVVLGAGLFMLIKKSNKVSFYFDYFIFKIPFIGEMLRNYNLANMTRTLGLLIKSGLTLSEALPVVRDTTSNLVYKEEMQKLMAAVNRGEKISVSLKQSRNFPAMLTDIVSIGEKSGNLADVFIYVSELYENEVENSTKNLSSLIEPVLMVSMGVIVGFVAISIITPIYGITNHLSPR